jgi:hypothetical protein
MDIERRKTKEEQYFLLPYIDVKLGRGCSWCLGLRGKK